MKTKQKMIISILSMVLFIASNISVTAVVIKTEEAGIDNETLFYDTPNAIAVSDSNPFYALIATPLACHYEEGEQNIIPLYVKDFDNPSKAVVRAEQEQIGITADFVISDVFTPKEASLITAQFWDNAPGALIIKDDQNGYNLGMVATPLASYLNIPVIVTDEIDTDVKTVLNNLEVSYLYICGELDGTGYDSIYLENPDEITDLVWRTVYKGFGENTTYIAMTNPLDITNPEVLDSASYEFSGTLTPNIMLPTPAVNSLIGPSTTEMHTFEVPTGYKYAQIKVDLKNLNYENSDSLGDNVHFMLRSPQGPYYVFGGTQGGIPIRDDDENMVEDSTQYEVTVYNNSGEYSIMIIGEWFASKTGEYDLTVTVEKLDNPVVPLMKQLSSLAPYLTAYHKGVIFAKPEFAFAADDHILFNGSTCPGVTQPGSNPQLLEPSNLHTMKIHDELNVLLANISDISVENLEQLREYYDENPMHIAIMADPTMIPMYFYVNPDGEPTDKAYMTGFGTPSDFIYGDIDVNKSDPENDMLSYWPYQENIVGRVTGRNAQDCSALIARTVFYDLIIENMDDENWKDSALVQTGCGLEFQNLPIITKLSDMLASGGHGEPTKFPTGEAEFINMRLTKQMDEGYSNVKNTFWLQSQREGFTQQDLDKIKKTGLMNMLLFPKRIISFFNSDTKVTGGTDHLNSNLIFSFAHGNYNLYEHGDVFIDSFGFPGLTIFDRMISKFRSSLSTKGAYSVRDVDNMRYGPSVVYIESCITGRTDGLIPENCLSQTYIHAGANTYIGATRFTADPGYLPPRPLPNGWGIGILGLMKAILDLAIKKEYPDAHFGAVIAEDFIIDLIENDATVGMALRNAKNMYLEKDANNTFLWTPPLLFTSGCSFIDEELSEFTQPKIIGQTEGSKVIRKKYTALHEFVLYGDPAFNPYQSVNEGEQ